MTTLERRIRLFLMGLCPCCETYPYDSSIDSDHTIQYMCHNCGTLNEVVKEIIDGLVS